MKELTHNKHTRITKASALARHPRTFAAVLESLPESLTVRLTATEIAQVMQYGRDQFNRGSDQGWNDAIENYDVDVETWREAL